MSKSTSFSIFLRQVGKSLLLILLSACVGTALLILSEFLPAPTMDRNLERSADIFQATGKFPNLHTWCSSRLDNYSDAIMLQMAGNVSAEHPVEYAMLSYHPVMGELDPVQIFVKHYIEGVPYEKYEAYSRYWHGYGVIYRLLLLMMDYHGIRKLNTMLQVGLILLICVMMYQAGSRGRGMIIPLLISYGMMPPTVMWMNLECSLGFYISMLAVMALLILYQKKRIRRKEYLVLLFAGICTAYWDVLTYPMAALGLPLMATLCLEPERNAKRALGRIIRLGFFWGLGYGLMWISKWIIGTVLTGYNVFEDGISTFMLRTGSEAYGESVTVWRTLWRNLKYFFHTPVSLLLLAYLVVAGILLVCRTRGTSGFMKDFGKAMIPYLLIAFIPLIWCAVTKNHANIHDWLASKAFIVSTMAVMCGLAQILSGNPLHEEACDKYDV